MQWENRLPSQTAACASVAQLASQEKKNIRELLRNKEGFLSVNEAEVDKQKYINVLAGSFDTPYETFRIECLPLESSSNVNNSIILHTVDNVLRQLGTKRENFALLLTDAARYTSLAGKTLKELYPTLMHVTCTAHLRHNCAMRVPAFFKKIDDLGLVATIKAATINNKDRKNDFCEAGLPSPPVRVITRWATNWLRAALYYSENLPAVCTIVSSWTGESLVVSRAKEAINVDDLMPDLVHINQYWTLATNVELLEASDCTMTEACELLKNMHFMDDPSSIVQA